MSLVVTTAGASLMTTSLIETPEIICPTKQGLEQQKTFKAVEDFLIHGADKRFGKFTPLDPRPNPKENLANKENGWRLFVAENKTVSKDHRTKEIVMCHKTIMLKSIIKTINSLSEVQEICQLHMPGNNGVFKSDTVTDGAFDTVTLTENAGKKTQEQVALLVKINAFVTDYLNAYAGLVHLPKEDAPLIATEC